VGWFDANLAYLSLLFVLLLFKNPGRNPANPSLDGGFISGDLVSAVDELLLLRNPGLNPPYSSLDLGFYSVFGVLI
jgi:hypothetical protein